MAKGPAPIPAALRRARGDRDRTPKHLRKLSKEERKDPTPEPGHPLMDPQCRANPIARRLFQQLARSTMKMKVLSAADGPPLNAFAMTYARALAAEESIAKDGMMVKGRWGESRANPMIRVAEKAWVDVRKLAVEFGLTPAARTRVREVPASQRTPEDSAKETAEDFFFASRNKIAGSIGPR